MAVNAGSVYVDLGARLDRREFEAYEAQLKKVQERTARREHFRVQLGGDFDARAFNAYERELKRVDRANDDAIRSSGKLHTAFGNIYGRGGALFAAAGSAYGLVTAIKSVTSAYADSQVSQEKMATQLKALNISYQEHAKQIDEVIQRTSKLAGLDDEDLQDAFTNIVRATGKVNESLKLTALAADLARAKHLDVAKAGQLLGRVATGNVTALSRYGVTIDKNATSTEALAAVQRKFGGQAEAYGKTQAGATDRVRVAWENLQETVGQRLAPSLTKAANATARFINQMQDGTGTGGAFVAVMGKVIHNFQVFGSHVLDDVDMIKGWGLALTGAGSKLPFVGNKLRDLQGDIRSSRDDLRRWREQLRISHEVDKINDDIDRLRDKMSGTLRGIRIATKNNMDAIRDTMGEESAAGQRALHRNFQAAVTAIRTAMRNGEVSTRTGLRQIRQEMLNELRTLGISSAERGGLPLSKDPPKGSLPVTTNSAGVTKYGGGWIGMPGMVGPDTVPAMLAPGEAVLNRHQQAVIEGMLGDGFLDRLFASVQRPHYMDRGGRIPFAVGGVTPAISSLISELDSKGFHHGSTTGGTHAPNSYHYRGMAVDYGDASNDMQRLWSVVFPQRARFAELFGPTRVNPGPHLMHNGAAFQDAGLQAQHEDHIHLALAAAIGALGAGSASAALGAVWDAIKAPQVGGSGALHDIVQGTLDRSTSLANQRGRSLARTASGDTGALSGFKGGGSNAANRALGQRMAAAMGWTGGQWSALDSLWTGESGWNASIPNAQGSGAYGIPQALPASKMASAGADWRTNPATQIKWGLGYIKERYGSPAAAYSAWLSRSPHWYAKGGKAPHRDAGNVHFDTKARTPKGQKRSDTVLGIMHALWNAGSHFYPTGKAPGFPPVTFADSPFVGVDQGTQNSTWGRMYWPPFMTSMLLDGRHTGDQSAAIQTIIHEWAHRFQDPSKLHSEWEAEGGAQNFARKYAANIARAAGFKYTSQPTSQDTYWKYVQHVRKAHGANWFGFAKGGKAKLPHGIGKATAGLVRRVKPLTTDQSAPFNALMARVDSADNEYSRWERRFNITDEELVDSDTGQLNVGAIQRKARELGQLLMIRAGMERDLDQARTVARNLVRSYRRVITALRKSLRHATKKDRSGIRSYISTYEKRASEWQGKIGETGDSLFDTHTDVLSLRGELKDVLGTSPQLQDTTADTTADTGGADLGGAASDIATTTAAPTAADIAAGVIQQMATFQQGRVDLLSQFAPNFATARQAYMPGGAFSGSPDELTAAAGVRYFGATGGGGLGGLAGASVTAHFASAPPDPPSFVQQVRFLVENGSG